jgi:(5-formylfuran-3-yl)methyl phosphate synthase
VKAARGGADIVDVKNPYEGSLGASFPWVIRKIRSALPKGTKLSATIGDLPYLPGTASLAALGASACGVDYVKAGLFGVCEKDEAIQLSSAVVRAVKGYDRNVKVVLAGYGDWERVGSINPQLLPAVASAAKADYVMIDTRNKRGKCLLDYMDLGQLRRFSHAAGRRRLKVGLAGSLGVGEIREIARLRPDVVGVRGAACEGCDRKARLTESGVRRLRTFLDEL